MPRALPGGGLRASHSQAFDTTRLESQSLLKRLLVSQNKYCLLFLFLWTPIVFETYGAAGPTTLEHMSLIRHQYGNVVLPCEDRSSESIFHSKWAYELSTALQLGNAEAIHNIPRHIRSQVRAPGDMVVEAVSLLGGQ